MAILPANEGELVGILQYHDVKHFKCNDLRRWKLQVGKLFSVRLHHWVEGDPPHYQHAHPWSFLTIVLWGGYDDVGEGRPVDKVRAPTVRHRDTHWRHSVINCLPRTWTIIITGRTVDCWRFWVGRRQVAQEEWNLRTCD